MITNVKEIYREFRLAQKHFKRAIELAKKSVLIGEINFPGAEKRSRPRKAKLSDELEKKEEL